MSESGQPPTPLTWFITGTSAGLGRLIAEAALDAGDTVVATARRPAELLDWAAERGSRLVVLDLDVTEPSGAARVIHEALAAVGRIDVLVNNAGRVHVGAVEEVTDEELKALFDLHVFGPTRLLRAVLPHMRTRGSGTIVQMSTMGSFFITPGFSSYTASKAALDGLSATLAEEVSTFGIRILIVQPGSHRTEIFSAASTATELPAYAQVTGPMRRFLGTVDGAQPGDPSKAAQIVVDLVRSGRELPLRLPLGADAVANIGNAVDKVRRDVDEWADVARSTAFADPSPST